MFWLLLLTQKEALLALKRQIVMRPLPEDHPDFTGGNPMYNDLFGPWDVDNDRDGIRESVWLDIGLPISTSPSGRQYKPLVAILCQDLDGRINLNAHGGRMSHPNFNLSTVWSPSGTTSNNGNNILIAAHST